MSRRTNLVAGRLATYLLAAASLPLVACMDGGAIDTPAVGEQASHRDSPSPGDRPSRTDDPTAGSIRPPSPGDLPSSTADTVGVIGDAGFAHQILGADVACTGTTAHVMVELSSPSNEVELRMLPQYKTGEYGRWFEVRQSYVLQDLLPAPHAHAFPYWAQVSLEGYASCDDFKAQVDQLRVTYDRAIETFDLPPASK